MNIFALSSFASIFISVYLGTLIYSQAPSNKLNKYFLIFNLLIAYSAFCEYFRLTAPNQDWAYIWYKASFLLPYFPIILLKFVFIHTNNKLDRSKKFNLFLIILPLFIIIPHLFTDLFFKGFVYNWYGWDTILDKNLLSTIKELYFFTILLITIFLITKYFFSLEEKSKNKFSLYILAGLFLSPFALFLSHNLLPKFGYMPPPLQSLANIIGSIVITIGILKYKLFTLDPLDTIKKMFETIGDYMLIVNKASEVILASNSFKNCSNYSEDEIIGTRLKHFIQIDDENIPEKFYKTTGNEVEVSIKTNNGNFVPISVVSSIVHGQSKRGKYYLLLGRDLSERKQYEENLLLMNKELEEKVKVRSADLLMANLVLKAEIEERRSIELSLRESEKRYRELIENATEIIYLVNTQGHIIFENHAAKKISGYTDEEETKSKKFYDFIHPDYKNKIKRAYFRQTIGKVKTSYLEFPIISKSDNIMWWAQSASLILDKGIFKGFQVIARDITEMKLAEIALVESELKYKNIFDFANIGIYQSKFDGKLNIANKTFANILGYNSVNEVLKKNIKDIYFDEEERNKLITRLNPMGYSFANEVKWKKKDGTTVWVQLSSHAIKENGKNTKYFEGFVTDITEIKQTQNALIDSEERYRSIFEYTSAVMLLIDPNDGSIKGANKAASKYYGYSKTKLLKMNISQINASEKSTSKLLLLNKNDNHPKEIFSKHKLANGELRYVAIHNGLIKINEKNIIFSIIYDITERRKAEKELEEHHAHLENLVAERTQKYDDVNIRLKEENIKLKIAERNIQNQLSFLQKLIDTIPNPIFICNEKKVYTGCNKAFEIFHGISKEQLKSMNVYQLTNTEIGKYHDNMDNEILKNRGEQKFEITIFNAEGFAHDAIVYKATFDKADGSVGGIVGILHDISEIKKLEKDILHALDKEKELSDLKSRFISVASHEFRTPLTTILSSADLLEMYGRKWPDEKYYKFVGNIQYSVEYMTQLINDLLIVSKSEAGKIEFNPEQTNLYELTENLYKNAKLGSPNIIKFSFEYLVKEKIFKLDSKLITQTISNLLSNAVKYSPNGGNVFFIVKEEGKYLLLSVIDNGIGIPDEDQSHLFEPFHRSNNVGAISGTGLGLSIAKKSTEIMGGELSIESKVNKGTKITVTLKLEDIQCSNMKLNKM